MTTDSEGRMTSGKDRRITTAYVAGVLLALVVAAVPAQAQNLPKVDKPDVKEPDVKVPDVQAPDAGLPGDPTQSPSGVPSAPGAGDGGGGNGSSGSDPGDSSGESSSDRRRSPGDVFDETGRPQGRRTLAYLNPFPVVRIRGAVYGGVTRIDLLRVLRPAGSRVYTRCRGGGCPFTRKASGFSVRTGIVPFGSWRRRTLRAGAALEVFVTRPGTIGKYTRLRIRAGRFPARYDGCVRQNERRPIPCAR